MADVKVTTLREFTDGLGAAFKQAEFNESAVLRAVERLSEEEINRRADLLIKGIEQHKKAELELRKIKPDVVTYNADGAETASSYSKAKFEELRKARENVERWEKAVNAAIEKADYQKLGELFKTPAADK